MSTDTQTRTATEVSTDRESDLPDGWTYATLSEVSEQIRYGYTASAIQQPKGPHLLRITDIQDGNVNWDTVPYCTIERDATEPYKLRAGDIVFARTGATTGKSFLIRTCPDSVFASYLIRVRAHRLVDPGFLIAFLNTPDYWAFISDNVAGNAQPNCNASKLAALQVPLAPTAEQKRIVTKIEELFKQVNACRDRLNKVPRILKRFRQSVLAAACSGRLTEDWRDIYTDVEPGQVLIEKIGEHRRQSGAHPAKPDESELEVHDFPELPESWTWERLGGLMGELRNGISVRPEQEPPGHPILRISSVRPGKVLLDNCRYLPNSEELVETYGLRNGDLLFTRYNGSLDLLGVCGLVRGLGSEIMLYPDKLMRVRFDHPFVLPEFTEIYFGSTFARDRITEKSKSSAGQQGVSGADIKAQPCAVPPFEEQWEIVRRVGDLFNLADMIEKRVEAATKRTDKLTQAILAKALNAQFTENMAQTRGGNSWNVSRRYRRLRTRPARTYQPPPFQFRSM